MNQLLTAKIYDPQDKAVWDDLTMRSAGGTFLFLRDYMEYHASRFDDYSLLFYRKGVPIAIFPANRQGDTVISHDGLTYGGIVAGPETSTAQILDIFDTLTAFLRESGIRHLVYKCVPYIYQRYPHAGDLYALYRAGATRIACNLSSTIEPARQQPYAELRRRGIKKALRAGVTIGESDDYAPFWEILSHNLREKFNTAPVHSLEEITMLHARFPNQIKLYTATLHNTTLAGTVIYDTGEVAHAQYICASPEGKQTGALDLLFARLIETTYSGHRYFDFGISTEQNGTYLNTGLLSQKEGFGARGTLYEIYRVDL